MANLLLPIGLAILAVCVYTTYWLVNLIWTGIIVGNMYYLVGGFLLAILAVVFLFLGFIIGGMFVVAGVED